MPDIITFLEMAWTEFVNASPLQKLLAVTGLSLLGGAVALLRMIYRAARAQRRKARLGAGRARIMVIDDDTKLLDAVAQSLQLEGYVVQTHVDPIAAVKALGRFDPDLLIIDGDMKPIGGVETLRRMRLKSKVPAIMYTAFDTLYREDTTLAGGFDDFVRKGTIMSTPALLARVEARLRRS